MEKVTSLYCTFYSLNFKQGSSLIKAGNWYWLTLQYSDSDVQDIYLQYDDSDISGKTKTDMVNIKTVLTAIHIISEIQLLYLFVV